MPNIGTGNRSSFMLAAKIVRNILCIRNMGLWSMAWSGVVSGRMAWSCTAASYLSKRDGPSTDISSSLEELMEWL